MTGARQLRVYQVSGSMARAAGVLALLISALVHSPVCGTPPARPAPALFENLPAGYAAGETQTSTTARQEPAPGATDVMFRPVAQPSRRPQPPPAKLREPRNWLSVPGLDLEASISDYGDCWARAPLTHAGAARFTCAPTSVTALLGHNPGPFSALGRARPGQVVDYWDAVGYRHRFHISTVERLAHDHADATVQDGSYDHLVLVTCAVPDGSYNWVVTARPL